VDFFPSIGPEVLWGFAIAMWAWDAKIRVIPGSTIFLTSCWEKGFETVENPVGAFRRWVHFPNPLKPFSIAVALPEPKISEQSARGGLEKWLFEQCLKPFDRIALVSGGIFLVLFVLTPLLTLWMSLLWSGLISLTLAYTMMLYQFAWLWRRRRMLRLNGATVISLCFHGILFPPYGANFARAVFAKTSFGNTAARLRSHYRKRLSDWESELQ
jgi:hypothetical protein